MSASPKVRVLIVDDSLVVRRILGEVLTSNPATEVIGTASSGELALIRIEQLKPDVVTLDVEMPGMGGLKALAEIRKRHPKLPVIMFSTLTETGAAATIEALALGATDYATKPAAAGGLAAARKQIEMELVGKILALYPASALAGPPKISPPPAPRLLARRVDVVAIGCSTGGPGALAQMIPQLPADFPVPVVIVQHMPPLFTKLLSERLNLLSKVTVQEGQRGQKLLPGHVFVAPGDYHMNITQPGNNPVLDLNRDAPENSCRPAVDVMFRGVAHVFGPHVLGVVLTGMGSDGALGARAIREAGGQMIVQDEPSSVVWGMPGAVAAAGLADLILPLGALVSEIVRRVSAHRSYAAVGSR